MIIIIHLPSLSITTHYNSDCNWSCISPCNIIVVASVLYKNPKSMWKYQKNKRASHRYWEKKKCTKILFRSKNLNVSEYIGEKKKMVLCICESNVCFRFFQQFFFLVFLFHKLSGTYPSSLGIAWVFRYTQFWKVLIFFFNLIKSFRTPFKKKRQQKISISAFQNPFFFLFSFFEYRWICIQNTF